MTSRSIQRGLLNIAHSKAEANAAKRVAYANRLFGIDAEWLEPDDIRDFCPMLEPVARRPVPCGRRDATTTRWHRPA